MRGTWHGTGPAIAPVGVCSECLKSEDLVEVAGTSAEVLEIDEVDQKFESRKSKTHTKRMSSEAVVSGTPERAWQGAAQVCAAPSSHLTTLTSLRPPFPRSRHARRVAIAMAHPLVNELRMCFDSHETHGKTTRTGLRKLLRLLTRPRSATWTATRTSMRT